MAHRSAGTFASARISAPSAPEGTVLRTVRRLGTGSIECRAMIAAALVPVNGGVPASIS